MRRGGGAVPPPHFLDGRCTVRLVRTCSGGLFAAISKAGYHPTDRPRVQVSYKAIMSDASDANITQEAGVVTKGLDDRFAYTSFPIKPLGDATAVQVLRQPLEASPHSKTWTSRSCTVERMTIQGMDGAESESMCHTVDLAMFNITPALVIGILVVVAVVGR